MKKIFTFMLSVMLTCMTGVMAAVVNITPNDSLHLAYASASDGDTLVLSDGTYTVGSKYTVNLTKSIVLQAQNQGQAVLTGYMFVVPEATTLQLLEFDGLYSAGIDSMAGDYFLQVNTATSSVQRINILNSKIVNFGRGVVRATTAKAVLDTLLINNCIFTANSLNNAGYGTVNPQKATISSITITNSTFYDQPSGLLRAESATSLALLIQNCTVLKCGSADGSQNMISAKGLAAGSKVENCIFSGCYDPASLLDKSINLNSADNGTISNCLLEGYSTVLTKGATVTNAVEASVTSYDFSQLTMTTNTEVTNIGDPRWTISVKATSLNQATDAGRTLQSIEYYDVTGRKTDAAAKGLMIEKRIYTDGTHSTVKTLK